MAKTFIEVTAVHIPNGEVKPLNIRWAWMCYITDKVCDVRKAAIKDRRVGIRYTCSNIW